jgi:histidine ammonia-lyase
MQQFSFGAQKLTPHIALQIANGSIQGYLSTETQEKIQKNRQEIYKIVDSQRTVYGINTGFGPLCTTKISVEDTATLQHNLLKSHAVGIGEPIAPEISMLMLVCKVQALAQGFSGIELATVQRILWFIQHNIAPVVPKQGSVGASGDLAPLSHLFLPLIGLGEVYHNHQRLPAAQVLAGMGVQPLSLGAKEGLALINGTQFIAAFGIKVATELEKCLNLADLAGAMSLEAMMGSAQPFDDRLHQLRPYDGSILVAKRLRALLQNSEILASHAQCARVQDPYSLRCMPQVHGASRNAWQHLHHLLEIELNSVTDNPIIFGENETISGGNFHGQPLALPLDYACLAAAELGNIADRRCYLLLEGRDGLPKLLLQNTGLNSGYMIAQYTTAALVSENKTLCYPASADSIPTSLGQEDHVSMGSIGARKAWEVVQNLQKILAIELLLAAQGLDFRRPMRSGTAIDAAHALIRQHISHATCDRLFGNDIDTIHKLVQADAFVGF